MSIVNAQETIEWCLIPDSCLHFLQATDGIFSFAVRRPTYRRLLHLSCPYCANIRARSDVGRPTRSELSFSAAAICYRRVERLRGLDQLEKLLSRTNERPAKGNDQRVMVFEPWLKRQIDENRELLTRVGLETRFEKLNLFGANDDKDFDR